MLHWRNLPSLQSHLLLTADLPQPGALAFTSRLSYSQGLKIPMDRQTTLLRVPSPAPSIPPLRAPAPLKGLAPSYLDVSSGPRLLRHPPAFSWPNPAQSILVPCPSEVSLHCPLSSVSMFLYTQGHPTCDHPCGGYSSFLSTSPGQTRHGVTLCDQSHQWCPLSLPDPAQQGPATPCPLLMDTSHNPKPAVPEPADPFQPAHSTAGPHLHFISKSLLKNSTLKTQYQLRTPVNQRHPAGPQTT